jgi:hypothetical protein
VDPERPRVAEDAFDHGVAPDAEAAQELQPHRAVASAAAGRCSHQSHGVPPLSPTLFLAMIQGMDSLAAMIARSPCV